MLNLIPKPVCIQRKEAGFHLSPETRIVVERTQWEVHRLAQYAADQLHLDLAENSLLGSIRLELNGDAVLSDEGYELTIAPDGIRLAAHQPAGLFYAIQTLLQIIPPDHAGTCELRSVSIRDTPRYSWRGAMLDVARHFFEVDDVKRYIDLISRYKMNRFHLHLTNDQGWRIEIKSWPRLTEIGSRTQVGGGGGGFYTQEQYREIVDYARGRFVTVIPEFDTPGHTNAALAAYAELNQSEEAPSLYEGIEVGFSTLWINSEITYRFLDDVVRELAAITPGPYIHIGGDEARSTPPEEYRKFIKRIQQIVDAHGKTAIGWGEIAAAELLPGTICQYWDEKSDRAAKRPGTSLILSPANRTYLDMKYDASTPLGLDWAALIGVKDAYDWEPSGYIRLAEENDILGIEAPIWSETLKNMNDLEYLAFPRLLCLAELAWSPKGRDWEEFRPRLAAHGKRMQALGINFYRSPEIDWE